MSQIKARQERDLDKYYGEEEEYYTNLLENGNDDNEWVARWSGCYPSMCFGEWTLYHNGKKVDVPIPFQEGDAGTYGQYNNWHFEDWEEVFDLYEDGLDEAAWIEENIDYLMAVTDDESQYPLIYEAFQAEDFRSGECGGCI